jgi:CDP-glucose 4,6-dehydratase
VIGGGDWAKDRIVPDAIRALRNRQSVPVRNQHATRPWQHVLEPLSGYLWLGVTLERPELLDREDASELCGAFNFGPEQSSERTVAELVNEIFAYMPGRSVDASEGNAPHEAAKLQLSIEKAQRVLGWRPVWNFGETVRETVSWYQSQSNGKDLMRATIDQIRRYETAATAAELPWAT